jgi:hypothetical protein
MVLTVFEAGERIFETCWLYVGHESEIPKAGDYRRRPSAPARSSSCATPTGRRALFNACTRHDDLPAGRRQRLFRCCVDIR